jgi:hypothetical protein
MEAGMTTSEEVLACLKSIDASLKRLIAANKEASSAPLVADDRDLDSQHGNGPVTFEPRDWSGEPCKGRPYSECPAPFLDMLAEVYDYFAEKADAEGDAKKAGYKRKDAARARGWAKRIRSGEHDPTGPSGDAVPEWA